MANYAVRSCIALAISILAAATMLPMIVDTSKDFRTGANLSYVTDNNTYSLTDYYQWLDLSILNEGVYLLKQFHGVNTSKSYCFSCDVNKTKTMVKELSRKINESVAYLAVHLNNVTLLGSKIEGLYAALQKANESVTDLASCFSSNVAEIESQVKALSNRLDALEVIVPTNVTELNKLHRTTKLLIDGLQESVKTNQILVGVAVALTLLEFLSLCYYFIRQAYTSRIWWLSGE